MCVCVFGEERRLHVKCNIYHLFRRCLLLSPRCICGLIQVRMSTGSQRWCLVYRCRKFNLAWYMMDLMTCIKLFRNTPVTLSLRNDEVTQP